MSQEEELTPEEAMHHLHAALQLYSLAHTRMLEEFATVQDRRAQRLAKGEGRLAAKLGDDNARVEALRKARDRTTELRRELRDSAARAGKLREIKSYEWMVYGQVVDARGKPVPNLVVRVFDKDRKLDDALGHTTTDKFGDFQLVYHERAFPESAKGAPELYLRVEDVRGNVLYSTREPIRYKAGQVEVFMIELEQAKDTGKGSGPARQN
jgi:hypothetical protein